MNSQELYMHLKAHGITMFALEEYQERGGSAEVSAFISELAGRYDEVYSQVIREVGKTNNPFSQHQSWMKNGDKEL